jgi:hypothetical protein
MRKRISGDLVIERIGLLVSVDEAFGFVLIVLVKPIDRDLDLQPREPLEVAWTWVRPPSTRIRSG